MVYKVDPYTNYKWDNNPYKSPCYNPTYTVGVYFTPFIPYRESKGTANANPPKK